jgi:hypothetical protein
VESRAPIECHFPVFSRRWLLVVAATTTPHRIFPFVGSIISTPLGMQCTRPSGHAQLYVGDWLQLASNS